MSKVIQFINTLIHIFTSLSVVDGSKDVEFVDEVIRNKSRISLLSNVKQEELESGEQCQFDLESSNGDEEAKF